MNLTEAAKDSEVMDCIKKLYEHKGFEKLRNAFVSHSPKAEKDGREGVATKTSVSIAHGQYLGTSYVFNKIEELASKPQAPKPEPKKRDGGQDPDLRTR